MQTINDRIEKIILEHFGGNKSAFAKAIGYKPQIMSTYLGTTRRSKPSIDMVAAILRAVDVDARWLILGHEGEAGASILATSSTVITGSHNTMAVDSSTNTSDAEQVKLLEMLLSEKDARIEELKERIEELKAK